MMYFKIFYINNIIKLYNFIIIEFIVYCEKCAYYYVYV